MTNEKELLMIANMLSSPELFGLTQHMVKPEYFSPEYQRLVEFILDYYDKYADTPALDLIEAETAIRVPERTVTKSEVEYSASELEKYCREEALKLAILESFDLMERGKDITIVQRKVEDALNIGLVQDLGVEIFDENIHQKYEEFAVSTELYSTGIPSLDELLSGGLARRTSTLFSANSGVGKSNIMSNIGVNYAVNYGFRVLYLSLELPEDMIATRLGAIISKVSAREWKKNILKISNRIRNIKRKTEGISYIVKKMASGVKMRDIEAYLKQYELNHGAVPDVIILDYLDGFTPAGGLVGRGISEIDKERAEEFQNLVQKYNAIGLTASQQNREALRNAQHGQEVIAGGLAKVNAVDNYFSMFMDKTMRANGELLLHAQKTRSSDGVGKQTMLFFDTNCLWVGDNGDGDSEVHVYSSKTKEETDQRINDLINSSPDVSEFVSDMDKMDSALNSMESLILPENSSEVSVYVQEPSMISNVPDVEENRPDNQHAKSMQDLLKAALGE